MKELKLFEKLQIAEINLINAQSSIFDKGILSIKNKKGKMVAFSGFGKYISEDGTIYTGQFKNGQLVTGKILTDSFEYIGNFKNHLLHGLGEKKERNGDFEKGKFNNGILKFGIKREGSLLRRLSTNKNGTRVLDTSNQNMIIEEKRNSQHVVVGSPESYMRELHSFSDQQGAYLFFEKKIDFLKIDSAIKKLDINAFYSGEGKVRMQQFFGKGVQNNLSNKDIALILKDALEHNKRFSKTEEEQPPLLKVRLNICYSGNKKKFFEEIYQELSNLPLEQNLVVIVSQEKMQLNLQKPHKAESVSGEHRSAYIFSKTGQIHFIENYDQLPNRKSAELEELVHKLDSQEKKESLLAELKAKRPLEITQPQKETKKKSPANKKGSYSFSSQYDGLIETVDINSINCTEKDGEKSPRNISSLEAIDIIKKAIEENKENIPQNGESTFLKIRLNIENSGNRNKFFNAIKKALQEINLPQNILLVHHDGKMVECPNDSKKLQACQGQSRQAHIFTKNKKHCELKYYDRIVPTDGRSTKPQEIDKIIDDVEHNRVVKQKTSKFSLFKKKIAVKNTVSKPKKTIKNSTKKIEIPISERRGLYNFHGDSSIIESFDIYSKNCSEKEKDKSKNTLSSLDVINMIKGAIENNSEYLDSEQEEQPVLTIKLNILNSSNREKFFNKIKQELKQLPIKQEIVLVSHDGKMIEDKDTGMVKAAYGQSRRATIFTKEGHQYDEKYYDTKLLYKPENLRNFINSYQKTNVEEAEASRVTGFKGPSLDF